MKVQIKLPQVRVDDESIYDEEGHPTGETKQLLIIPFKLPELGHYLDQVVRVELPTTKSVILAAMKVICKNVQQKNIRDKKAQEVLGAVETFDIDIGE